MQKRFLPALFTAAVTFITCFSACTKIDNTTLGADVLAVDNVNTFADTLDVVTTQNFIADSTVLSKYDTYAVGNISNDPLFGKTEAAVNVQFKPTFYPFYFGSAGSIVKPSGTAVGLDSVIVCLSYRTAWGDTSVSGNIPQQFEVHQITDPRFASYSDTAWKLSSPVTVSSTVWGTATITPAIIAQTATLGRQSFQETVNNQIRIKLNSAGLAFFRAMYDNGDSSATGGFNVFFNDVKFRTSIYGSGLQIKAVGAGNTIYYVNPSDVKSRLEFHFKKKASVTATTGDTLVQSFQMYPAGLGTTNSSSCYNYINRDYTGSQVAAPLPNQNYLQTTPGENCFVNIRINGLNNYPNRIIHRAFLAIEQTPDNPNFDKWYSAPDYLYLDLKTPVTTPYQQYKPVYFDLNSSYPYNPDVTVTNGLYHPYPANNVSSAQFGGYAIPKTDAAGNAYTRYEINLTRYIQHVITNGYTNYDLRLFAPFNYYYPQYPGNQYAIPYYNTIAKGRVRVGGGSTGNVPHKMRMIIIYSKI